MISHMTTRSTATIGHSLRALAAFLLAPAARAGFTTVDTLGPGDVGKTLQNGTIYKVTANATLSRGSEPMSALYVVNNATAVIYLPKGITLNVHGGHANGVTGAGSGIRLDNGSTLVVTGGGTLNVTGGNGGYGFFEKVRILSSTTLPIPDDAVVDTREAESTLEDDGSITYTVTLPPEEGSRFFRRGAATGR